MFLPKPRTAILTGTTLRLADSDEIRLSVNARSLPKKITRGTSAGMISAYLVQPGISPATYAALRMTSHFGQGHLEIAFYEHHDFVVVYAVRDILKSNLRRIPLILRKRFENLRLTSDNDAVVVIRQVLQVLKSRGINAKFASAEECVALAVDAALLAPAKRRRTIEALNQRYRRLSRRLGTANRADTKMTHRCSEPGPGRGGTVG